MVRCPTLMLVITVALAVGATIAVHACMSPKHGSQFTSRCLAKVQATIDPYYPNAPRKALDAAVGVIAQTRANHGAVWRCSDAVGSAETIVTALSGVER